ncbi:MAG TPA: hypothetical protein VJ851_16615 [Jatrophihabitans sp.]|nr:hypothetical protein [Jatrophihabitans sp.]
MNNVDHRVQGLCRLGMLDALIAALHQREAVCDLIGAASDEAEARLGLSRLLAITDEQACAVLEIRLGPSSRIGTAAPL